MFLRQPTKNLTHSAGVTLETKSEETKTQYSSPHFWISDESIVASTCSVGKQWVKIWLFVIARLKAREAVKNLQEMSHMERNFNAKFLNEEV